MKYQLDFSAKISTVSPPIAGALVSGTSPLLFTVWQPSTWPAALASAPGEFIEVQKRIFEESILGEVCNVIEDITKSDGIRYAVQHEVQARKLARKTLRWRATARKRVGVPYRFCQIIDPHQWFPIALT